MPTKFLDTLSIISIGFITSSKKWINFDKYVRKLNQNPTPPSVDTLYFTPTNDSTHYIEFKDAPLINEVNINKKHVGYLGRKLVCAYSKNGGLTNLNNLVNECAKLSLVQKFSSSLKIYKIHDSYKFILVLSEIKELERKNLGIPLNQPELENLNNAFEKTFGIKIMYKEDFEESYKAFI